MMRTMKITMMTAMKASTGMLAPARQADPETIAEREEEFEMQVSRRLMEELPASSSAATVNGGSGASSAGSESSGDIDIG